MPFSPATTIVRTEPLQAWVSALRRRSSSGPRPTTPAGREHLLGGARDQPVELAADGGGVLRAVRRVGRHEREDQAVERLGHACDAARRRRRRAHPEQVLGVERPDAAQQLVQGHPEGEEVAERGRGLAEGLLGRGVARRAGRRRGLALGDRDAEVAERGLALGVDPDVVGLDVAVHDAVGVGVGERVGDLASRRDHLLRLQPARGGAFQPVRQGPAGHVAGDEARGAVVLEDVVDGDDVAVAAEPRGEPRLAPQPLPRAGPGHARERDAAVEREVVGEPDVLGRAAAELALQEVAAGDHPGRDRDRRGSLRRRDRARRAGTPTRRQRATAIRARGALGAQVSGVYGRRCLTPWDEPAHL